jgi:hypothetical protein
MSAVRMMAWVGAGVLLAACQSFPAYLPPANANAMVDVSRTSVTTICTGGKGYSVGKAARGGKLALPTDAGPVTLYAFVYLADYNVSYTCTPGLSFQPVVGGEYLFNIELEDQRCLPDLYRQGTENRTGLAIEASVGRPGACAMPGR